MIFVCFHIYIYTADRPADTLEKQCTGSYTKQLLEVSQSNQLEAHCSEVHCFTTKKNANKPIKLHLLNSEISQIYAKSLLGGYSVSSSNYAFFTGLDVKDSLKNMEQRQIIYADANRLVCL